MATGKSKTTRRRPYRDDRPYGYGPDPFEPNNMPNQRDLGHGVKPDNSLAWFILVIIIVAALVLA